MWDGTDGLPRQIEAILQLAASKAGRRVDPERLQELIRGVNRLQSLLRKGKED